MNTITQKRHHRTTHTDSLVRSHQGTDSESTFHNVTTERPELPPRAILSLQAPSHYRNQLRPSAIGPSNPFIAVVLAATAAASEGTKHHQSRIL